MTSSGGLCEATFVILINVSYLKPAKCVSWMEMLSTHIHNDEARYLTRVGSKHKSSHRGGEPNGETWPGGYLPNF